MTSTIPHTIQQAEEESSTTQLSVSPSHENSTFHYRPGLKTVFLSSHSTDTAAQTQQHDVRRHHSRMLFLRCRKQHKCSWLFNQTHTSPSLSAPRVFIGASAGVTFTSRPIGDGFLWKNISPGTKKLCGKSSHIHDTL